MQQVKKFSYLRDLNDWLAINKNTVIISIDYLKSVHKDDPTNYNIFVRYITNE